MSERCSHCKEGTLELITGVDPWSVDHWMCDECDSTYPLLEDHKQLYLAEQQMRLNAEAEVKSQREIQSKYADEINRLNAEVVRLKMPLQ